jgi:selenocysteine lyase/cysteine desulfurase
MIYLDNAATTWPKPKPVLETTASVLFSCLGNPGRSGHKGSRESAEIVFSAREKAARFLGTKKSENIVFTSGATSALNIAVLGAVEELGKRLPKPLVIISVFEHNSVLRPLFRLEKQGKIRLLILPPDENGSLSLDRLTSQVPDLLVLTARSNVTGRSFPLLWLSRLLKPLGTLIIVDAAQSLGTEGANFIQTGAHILCAPSHKGLFGIMGAGILAFSDDCPLFPEPILTGGSGTDSFSPLMPERLPERLEAGTLPVPAIASISAGISFLETVGLSRLTNTERENKKILRDGILSLRGWTVYEPNFPDGPLLANKIGVPSEEIAHRLSEKGIAVRAGFHCAPLAHRFLGTEESGGVRFSPGFFTTKKELFHALNVLDTL